MDCKEAMAIFENNTKKSVVQIERCSIGIANYVFAVSTAAEKFILRCSKERGAYEATADWLNKLSVCEIPVPVVLSKGTYGDHSFLILSYIPGDDIGTVYDELNDDEKKQIAKEAVAIQRRVSRMDIATDRDWTWNDFIDELLDRAHARIKRNRHFDTDKIHILKKIRQEIKEYLDAVRPTPYLDDISTKIC